MQKIWYSLLLGLVAVIISVILGYLVEGKVSLVPTLGPAIGITLVAFFLWPE